MRFLVFFIVSFSLHAEVVEHKFTRISDGKEFSDAGEIVTRESLRQKIIKKHGVDPEAGGFVHSFKSLQTDIDSARQEREKMKSAKQWYRKNVNCSNKPTQEERAMCRILKL